MDGNDDDGNDDDGNVDGNDDDSDDGNDDGNDDDSDDGDGNDVNLTERERLNWWVGDGRGGREGGRWPRSGSWF